jgi:pantetheine-phosphate adenylyltransferase
MVVRETVILGGTFNRFHKGHRLLLEFATFLGERIIVGITSEEFASNKHHPVESFEHRFERVLSFLRGREKKIEVFKIDDFAGPSISIGRGTLLATSNTIKNSILINEIRARKGLPPLEILLAPLLEAEDYKPISSLRISRGEINEEGCLRR